MIQLSKLNIFFVIIVCLYGILYSIPNMVSSSTREWMAVNLPAGFPKKTVNLGLDLRGGAHLVYAVDLEKVFVERSEVLAQDIKSRLKEKELSVQTVRTIEKGYEITLQKPEDSSGVKSVISQSDSRLEVSNSDDGLVLDVKFSQAQMKEIEGQVISQVIEVIRRRVDELGTTEPAIQRQGADRVIIQVPGANAEELKRIIGRTAKLSFHLLGNQERRAASDMSLPMEDTKMAGQKINVKRQSVLTGDMLDSAQTSFGQNGEVVVGFRFNSIGARRFCEVTKNNTGQPFAIVLDAKVISAPRINEPICAGSGQISGNFTTQEASDLALLLRAGALPAEMNVVEERSVGPSLGADSVAAGKTAGFAALIIVFVFMVVSYGFFGLLAGIALLFNVALIIAILSSIQATLTLPGIAGIVLTIGVAVDANVLIFERIREEFKSGRSAVSSVEAGYQKAMTTILDSNLTTLIAGLILFMIGTGPIKGFAVTLAVGVITSYFSAIMVTRLFVVLWLRRNPRLKELPL